MQRQTLDYPEPVLGLGPRQRMLAEASTIPAWQRSPSLLFVLGARARAASRRVVAYRLPRGESFVGGRSRCPACGAQIAARDNVPIVSWLSLRGRCRSCGAPISPRYPLAEAGLGALWAATYLILGSDDGGRARARARALRAAGR